MMLRSAAAVNTPCRLGCLVAVRPAGVYWLVDGPWECAQRRRPVLASRLTRGRAASGTTPCTYDPLGDRITAEGSTSYTVNANGNERHGGRTT
jgi:hypothetical protein